MVPDSESRPAAGRAAHAGGWPRGRAALPFWLGLAAVAASRFLSRPRSLWEYDEVLFAWAVERFAPLVHHPHPPGYPLLVGLGKLFALLFGDPFPSLVALAVVASIVGYVALVDAFRRIAAGLVEAPESLAIAAALLVHLSPAMLVQGPLPMSDPPALMFVSLALAAAARLAKPTGLGAALESGESVAAAIAPAVGVAAASGPSGGSSAAIALGAASAAAIGCRPQLAVAVLPFLAAALVVGRGGRARLASLVAFTLVALAWFVPLLVAVGGPQGLLAYELGHAGRIAAADEATWRIGWSGAAIATRFLAHPWGLRWVSLPLLALAVGGTVRLVRRRVAAAWPLAVLTLTQLAICLAVLEPADGVRYALPTLLGVAFAATVGAQGLLPVGRRGSRALWLLPALVGWTAALYTAPLLRARAGSLSPPAQAAAIVRGELPRESLLLVEKTLQVHAAYLVGKNRLALPEAGLEMMAAKPQKPVWLLAEGASAWPGARVFAWPDCDAYGKLTRNHYRVVSLVPVSAARRYAVVRGVFDFEFTPPEPGWRWAAPDAAVRVVPRGATRVRLRLALLDDAPLAANSIAIVVGAAPAATVEVPRGESREVVLPLPATQEVEISFRAATSFVPAEIGYGTDRRRLAFQLVALEMLP